MVTFITRHQLIEAYPVPSSRPGLSRWVKKYGFPKPYYANHNTPLWSPDEVDSWFISRPNNHPEPGVIANG